MTTLLTELPLSAPVNLRDLAGIPVSGGVMRAGFAIRTDDLSTVDPDTAADLVDGGLSAVIDLRSAAEVGLTGRGPLAALPVTYHHVPFLTSIGEATQDVLDQSTFERMYVGMVERAAPRIVQALAIMATATGATAFHCAAGQDRTGVLAALLLKVLGAEDEVIVADYARTGENSTAIMERLRPVMQPLLAAHGVDLEAAAQVAGRSQFSPAPMEGLLAHLERTFADPLEPLRAAGLTPGLVDALRERAVA
ncbi:tyrosine-protein phosphatase [Brachybacterium sp. YJGR34]|uniref:tyrosine-protein phosphatase n=1 Tax=Brachybacterium sp. YJGR34 TaxID=2059911 RepID=UPI000E0C75DE|nr:tyrosine-protein phosphatase [Brachybacterium sp. YJGR34]